MNWETRYVFFTIYYSFSPKGKKKKGSVHTALLFKMGSHSKILFELYALVAVYKYHIQCSLLLYMLLL